jgi:hypothetical protein
MYHIDGSRTTTNMDSFNVVTTTLAGQSSAPLAESPRYTYFVLLSQEQITLLWLESTPRASVDDVSRPFASKFHI